MRGVTVAGEGEGCLPMVRGAARAGEVGKAGLPQPAPGYGFLPPVATPRPAIDRPRYIPACGDNATRDPLPHPSEAAPAGSVGPVPAAALPGVEFRFRESRASSRSGGASRRGRAIW